MKELFVTGTDTDVGKTFVSKILVKALQKKDQVTYFKPIQSGEPTDFDEVGKLSPPPRLKKSSYVLKKPASPNRAAAAEGVEIEISKIIQDWKARESGFHVVEGAGGIMVPVNKNELVLDLIEKLEIPVVVVASTRLGTINHTLLTIEALKNRSVPILGLVLNGEEDPGLKELLEQRSGVSVLFEVPPFSDQAELEIWMEKDQDLNEFINYFVSESFSDSRSQSIERLDQKYVWHPFTQHGIVKSHPLVQKGRGATLNVQGRGVLDAISSWWVNLLGHCEPSIVEAVSRQVRSLEHVIFAGFTHEPAVELSERLVQAVGPTGANLERVFFSDNGSTSVEVALKMAFQYHQVAGQSQRTRFLAFRGSYHGDTLGAMSVGERKGFNEVFTSLMFDVDFVDPFDLSSIERAFQKNGNEYAAIVFEPMVQGASGMRMYGADVLNQVEVLTQKYGVLKICDEVFTGFYRTGKMFAFEHSKVKPDFLCLSKGLTGGFLPLAVTLTRDSIYQAFNNEDMRKAFLHGHSYTANPIACAAANATLSALQRDQWLERITWLSEATAEWVQRLGEEVGFFNPRSLGTIGALELNNEDPNYFKGDFSYRFNQAALRRGVLLRPLGGTVYTVPPYCVTKNELEKIYEVIRNIRKEEF